MTYTLRIYFHGGLVEEYSSDNVDELLAVRTILTEVRTKLEALDPQTHALNIDEIQVVETETGATL